MTVVALRSLVMEVEVAALFTTWSGDSVPVEPFTLVSPLYTAVMVWVPAVSADQMSWACA